MRSPKCTFNDCLCMQWIGLESNARSLFLLLWLCPMHLISVLAWKLSKWFRIVDTFTILMSNGFVSDLIQNFSNFFVSLMCSSYKFTAKNLIIMVFLFHFQFNFIDGVNLHAINGFWANQPTDNSYFNQRIFINVRWFINVRPELTSLISILIKS